MRGMLVKMCLVIGTRSDVFPPQYVKTLSQCHDRLPARDFATIKTVVEEDFGKPLEAVFSEFSPTAVAAASLAQVHRARLVDGREVAVKVQYPDIEEMVRIDLSVAPRGDNLSALRLEPDGLPAAARRDAAALEMELDFRREAASAERTFVFCRRSHRAHSGDPARVLHAPRDHDGVRRRGQSE
jgi:ubiquinone biosynthesis protein